MQFGPTNGRMVLRTGRTGVAASRGHDLTLEITDWSVQIDVPDSGPTNAAVTARMNLQSLAVREGTGGSVLTDIERGEIKKNSLRTLGADQYPTATFESSRVAPTEDHTTISGSLTLHGVAAPVDVDVREVRPSHYRATTVITQSAHGIKPFAAFLGALKVRDDVEVEIEGDVAS